MDRKFKENTCLKTPANSNLISQVYQNSMVLFTGYSNLRKSFEADIMSNIEKSLAAALNSLATEKVSFCKETVSLDMHYKISGEIKRMCARNG